jgi:nucleotide-binding universal stress UspA family protein
VFHPSDFSEASESAFAHALAIALLRQTQLAILHADPEEVTAEEWVRFPGVRRTLERWGLLAPGSPRSALRDELDLRVEKVITRDRDPARAALEYIRDHAPDLLVLATEPRRGLPAWLQRSVAAEVAFRSRTLTLFVPAGCRPFVALADGHTSLRRILVPVAEKPRPDAALTYATRAAEALGDRPVEITVLHVGEEPGPDPALAEGEPWRWLRRTVRGDPVERILAAAEEADLIVMATAGREGVLDALRGSVTERVLRAAPCPVLAVPEI